MFLETPGQLHAVSYNAGATKPEKLLTVLLAEKAPDHHAGVGNATGVAPC